MKGIIFSEFLELVEETFGLEVCQDMLDENSDEGAYTSAGTYDHHDLVKLIITLSKITNIGIEELQEVYGKWVFTSLLRSMPGLEVKSNSTFEFINQVEDYIHIEVNKLYDDAKPPQFIFISQTESEMVLDYISARCFSHVCFGLIQGCAAYYDEKVEVQMQPVQEDGSQVRFTIRMI